MHSPMLNSGMQVLVLYSEKGQSKKLRNPLIVVRQGDHEDENIPIYRVESKKKGLGYTMTT